jgi:putative hydrolase of the HAD superfamily
MPSTQFDAVLFDFGGVLSDGPFDFFARYEVENGLPEGFIRQLNATNHSANAWAMFERSEIGIDEFYVLFEEEAKLAGGAVDARLLMAGISGELRPAMVEAVRRCKEHYLTGLLTNNFVRTEENASLGWLPELFDTIVESAIEGVRKPDPRFYLIACDRLAVEPNRCVFLDDLGVNLKPARDLGMTTIKVTDATEAIASLESYLGIRLSDP